MKLSAIVDFYMLERMYYECNYTNVPVDNGESYDVKRESIRTRINIEYNRLARELSEAFRDYLWVAAFGESRHAWRKLENAQISPDIPRSGKDYGYREGSMRHSTEFSPAVEQNYNLLLSVYMDHEWHNCGFGGKAWGKIVEACKRYQEWPSAVFVDYVVDLQHNSGTVFNKWEAQKFIDLEFEDDNNFYFSMGDFLGLKMNTDNVVFDIPSHMGIWVSRTVRNLIREWYPITPAWVHATAYHTESHSYHSTQWGNRVMSDQLVSSDSMPKRKPVSNTYAPPENVIDETRRDRRLREGQINCVNCGRVAWSDECHWDENKGLLCRVCFHRFYRNCNGCGRVARKSTMHDVGGSNEYVWVCDECYCENYTECHSCGDVISNEYSYHPEESEYDYCEGCYHKLFATCEECGNEFFKDDMTCTETGEWHCDDCYHDKFPECPSCEEHDESGEYAIKWCNTCNRVEHWCMDCLTDDNGAWVHITGHELSNELPALATVTRNQLAFQLAL